jgi:hypothetical protein
MAIRPIVNTATGQVEENPIDQNTGGPKITPVDRRSQVPEIDTTLFDISPEAIEQFEAPVPDDTIGVQPPIQEGPAYGDSYQDYSNIDFEYVGKFFDGEDKFNNMAAESQGTMSKIGNSLGGGLTKGVVAFASPFLEGLSHIVAPLDQDVADMMKYYDDDLKASLSETFNYNDYDISENAGFLETFMRYNTMDSIVESATQFGLQAATMNWGIGALGSRLMTAGASTSSLLNAMGLSRGIVAKGAQFAQSTFGQAGRFMTQPVTFGSLSMPATSTAVRSIANKYMEGKVMAEQYGFEQEALYQNILGDPAVSDEVKATIRNEIEDSKSDLILQNMMFVGTDYIGFAKLNKLMSKAGLNKKGLKALSNLGVAVAPMEAAEELGQSLLQSSLEHKLLLDVEKGYSNLSDEFKISGVDGVKVDDNGDIIPEVNPTDPDPLQTFKSESTLLAQVDPKRAYELASDNARTLGNFIMSNATDSEALVEAASGLFGGGPQWMITGAPSYVFNRKELKRQEEEKEALRDDLGSTFKAQTVSGLKNEAQLDAIREELQKSTTEESPNQYLNEDLDEYIVTKSMIDALEKGQADEVLDVMSEQRSQNQLDLKNGEITQDEFTKLDERISKAEGVLNKYRNLGTYLNGPQLLETALQEEALRITRNAMTQARASHGKDTEVDPTPKPETKPETPTKENASDTATEEAEAAVETPVEEAPKKPDSVIVKHATKAGKTKEYNAKKKGDQWVFTNAQGKEVYGPGTTFKNVRQRLVDQVEKQPELFDDETEVPDDGIAFTASDEDYIRQLDQAIIAKQALREELMSSAMQVKVGRAMKLRRKYETMNSDVLKSNNPTFVRNQINSINEKITKSTDPIELGFLFNLQENVQEHLDKLTEVKKEESLKDVKVEPTNPQPDATPPDNVDESDSYSAFNQAPSDTENVNTSTPPKRQGVNKEYGKTLAEMFAEYEAAGKIQEERLAAEAAQEEGTDTASKEKLTMQEYVKENPNKPTTAADEGKFGSQEVENAKANRVTDELFDENTITGSEFTGDTRRAQKVVSDLFYLYARLNNNEKPTFDSLLNMSAQIMQEPKNELHSFVQAMYSFVTNQPIENVRTNQRVNPEKFDAPDPYKLVTGTETSPDDVTTASFVPSATAASWDGNVVINYNDVHEGMEVEFKVLTDEEVAIYNEQELENARRAGRDALPIEAHVTTGSQELITMPWEEFTKLRKEGDALLNTPDYSPVNSQPIQVIAKSGPKANAPIGFVHTMQWVRKPRKKVTPVDVDKAALNLERLRKSIADGKVTGKLTARKENIKVSDNKIAGTAFRTNPNTAQENASTIYAQDENLVYTVVEAKNKITDIGLGLANKSAYAIEGNQTKVVVHDGLLPGTPVVLVPIENTGHFEAKQLTVGKADRVLLEWAVQDLRNLVTSDKLGRAPDNVKTVMSSVINVDTDLSKGAVKGNTQVRITSNINKSDPSKGTLNIEWKLGSKKGMLTLEGTKTDQTLPKSSMKGWTYEPSSVTIADGAMTNNFMANPAQGIEAFFEGLNVESMTEQQLPYAGIDVKLLHKSQLGGQKVFVPKVKDNGSVSVAESSNYVRDVLLPRSTTALAPGYPVGGGKFNYNVNTILSIATEEALGVEQAEASQLADQAKAANEKELSESRKMVGNLVALRDIQKKIKGAKDKEKSLAKSLSVYPDARQAELNALLTNLPGEGTKAENLEEFNLVPLIKGGQEKVKNLLKGLSYESQKKPTKLNSFEELMAAMEGKTIEEEETADPKSEIVAETGDVVTVKEYTPENQPSVTLESFQEAATDRGAFKAVADRLVRMKYLRTERKDGTKC